jgi:chorismate synthase
MIIFVVMAGNIFGEIFRLITFGESHGPVVGGVIDGCPAGLRIDMDFITADMQRRRPGLSNLASARVEKDAIEFLSGISGEITLGTPIAFQIRNQDARPGDYFREAKAYRPSHADYTTEMKYGIHDPRGGGRSSGRETAVRVAAGAIAKLLLKESGIVIKAYTCQIGPHCIKNQVSPEEIERYMKSPVGCPDEESSRKMTDYLEQLKKEGDTCGGMVRCLITGVPAGLGEPVFDKLHADLGKAILSIGACKGFEIGSGFKSAGMKGSEHNDPFVQDHGLIRTLTNHSGGIQGGISNGEEIWLTAAFKPVPSIHQPQQTLDTTGHNIELNLTGRHDVCVIPRVLPVVEAMAALVLADHLLRNRSSKTKKR